jgi:hypothetical protein
MGTAAFVLFAQFLTRPEITRAKVSGPVSSDMA